MRTLRNKPSLCALRNARSERAICDGALCIDPALVRDQYHFARRRCGKSCIKLERMANH
jgi:hypothetical protein